MSSPQARQPERGYLANISMFTPLIYTFQYNPSEVTDSKRNTLGRKSQSCANQGGVDIEANVGVLGRLFSNAALQKIETEGDRTLSFKIDIDGREQRPGEPAFRRNQAGDILQDLDTLRSFMYPQVSSLTDILQTAANPNKDFWSDIWFNEPPTALLILGDLVMEGFVTDLSITETLFNADLNPVKANVSITLTEKTDSLYFARDAMKRINRTLFASAL